MAILKSGFYATKCLSFEEKAIIRTILDGLEIQRGLDILEISSDISISNEGLFDKFKCQVLSLCDKEYEKRNNVVFSKQKIDDMVGGQFDYIFVFNYADKDCIDAVLKCAEKHICENGKIVFINTRKLICENTLGDNILSKVDNILTSANFSLYIINY